MIQKPKQTELLTREQVCVRLNMSRRTLYRNIQIGVVPAPLKIGGLIRWRSDVLDDWIENNCKPLKG